MRMHYVTAGTGEPLVFLHGYPQSWYTWRKIVPLLADRYRLIMPDLRGYGDTDKPLDGYDKRTMASDIKALAEVLGLDKFGLVAHDRGARVAHRYALDHGETLTRMMLLDIEPTRHKFENLNQQVASGSWHWFFIPVADLGEEMITNSLESWITSLHRMWAGNPGAIEADAIDEYLRTFRIPGTVRATCADYRAGATVDLEQDRADDSARIEVPLRILWGGRGKREALWSLLDVWGDKALQVEGRGIAESGHFIPEEVPEILSEEIDAFFGTPKTMLT